MQQHPRGLRYIVEGHRLVREDLRLLVPFSRKQHDVSGRAARNATSMAAPRSSSTMNVTSVARTPSITSSMMAIGSSLRGLSL